MHYTKEWTIEVREDIFKQIRTENDLLTQENVELRNKLRNYYIESNQTFILFTTEKCYL